MIQQALFDQPGEEASPHRVAFLSGLLAEWALGGRKPTAAQRDELEATAREALRRAGHLSPQGGKA